MSDMTRDRDAVVGREMGRKLDAALAGARVLTEEYAGYDEGAARRRVARRIVADRTRSACGTFASGTWPGHPARSPASDDLVLDAACHVRAARGLDDLAWSLVESRAFAELALDAGSWPHGVDSALLFGCLLHLADRMEGAQFWFQYAAGAGSRTAARCLYLHHLARAEAATARHWRRQAEALAPEDHLPLLPQLPEGLEEALAASVIWTTPPISTQDLAAVTTGPGRAGRPPYRLPARLRRAVTARVWPADQDLGEVYLPTAKLAVAVAQYARLDPLLVTDGAEAADGADGADGADEMNGVNAWALEALGQPQPTRAGRTSPGARPAPAALKAVHRALRVLEVITRYSGGVSLTQIARETQLPQLMLAKATQQLVQANLAAQTGPDAYVAGAALSPAGAANEYGRGRGHLREALAWVRDAVGAAVYVARYTDGEISITQYADGPTTPLVDEWVDFRAAAHASAVGKALLAQLDDDSRKDHLCRHRTTRLTSHTITSEQALFHQLDAREPNAPVLDMQEYALGTVCAAVPITSGPNAECLALSIPATDPHRLRQAARTLQSEAAAVLLALIVAGDAVGAQRPGAAAEAGAARQDTTPQADAGGPGGSILTPTV